MLKPILKNLSDQKYFLNNLDINLICEKPKVSIYRKKIIKSLTHLLDIDANQINIKGKTVEKLGLIGKEKAIACETIISILFKSTYFILSFVLFLFIEVFSILFELSFLSSKFSLT